MEHKRPSGRARKGMRWDKYNGRWIDENVEDTGPPPTMAMAMPLPVPVPVPVPMPLPLPMAMPPTIFGRGVERNSNNTSHDEQIKRTKERQNEMKSPLNFNAPLFDEEGNAMPEIKKPRGRGRKGMLWDKYRGWVSEVWPAFVESERGGEEEEDGMGGDKVTGFNFAGMESFDSETEFAFAADNFSAEEGGNGGPGYFVEPGPIRVTRVHRNDEFKEDDAYQNAQTISTPLPVFERFIM